MLFCSGATSSGGVRSAVLHSMAVRLRMVVVSDGQLAGAGGQSRRCFCDTFIKHVHTGLIIFFYLVVNKHHHSCTNPCNTVQSLIV